MMPEAPRASFKQVLSISGALFVDWTEGPKKHAVDLSCIGILVLKKMTAVLKNVGEFVYHCGEAC